MVQNPKGGGLSSSFGGGGVQQLGGVKKTTDFLDKSTWTLAIILLALILLSNLTIVNSDNKAESKVLDNEYNSEVQSDNSTPQDVPLNLNNNNDNPN